MPEERTVIYTDNGSVKDVHVSDTDMDTGKSFDNIINVYNNDGTKESLRLSRIGEKFGFIYESRLVFLHSSDLRNMLFWGIDIEDDIIKANKEVGDMLDRGYINESICIRHVGVVGDDGVDVGFGIFAENTIKEGAIIGEYVGVVWKCPSCSNSCYALDYPSKDGGYMIDALEMGNVIRMINHSEKFNCTFKSYSHNNMIHIICVSTLQ